MHSYIEKNKGLLIFESLLFIVIGIFAIAAPQVFTLSFELLIGALLVVGGLAQGWRALKTIGEDGFFPTLFAAIVYLVAGGLLLVYPLTGVLTLTLLLTVFLIFDGIAKIAMSFSSQRAKGWGWLLVSGILSLVLAGLIFAGLPSTAIWVIGLLIGINLLFFGLALLFLALSV